MTPCLQGQWLSSNVGPRFTCEDEGDDKVVDVEGGVGLGYESKWWIVWLWMWGKRCLTYEERTFQSMTHFCSLWLVVLSLYSDCRADSVKLQLYYATLKHYNFWICGSPYHLNYSEKMLNISNPHVGKITALVVPISHFKKRVFYIFDHFQMRWINDSFPSSKGIGSHWLIQIKTIPRTFIVIKNKI